MSSLSSQPLESFLAKLRIHRSRAGILPAAQPPQKRLHLPGGQSRQDRLTILKHSLSLVKAALRQHLSIA